MFVGSGPIGTSVLLLCLLLHVCGGTPDSDRELCYSRQHRDVSVNVHMALEQTGTVMVARAKPSEKDCILTCCSEDVGPGVKCNLVVYKPPERPGAPNCQLFHCPNERDCPLMTASAGINTYNIYKGVSHPTTKGTGRITAKPAAPQLTTTTPTSTPTTTPTSTSTTTPTTTLTTTPTSTPTTTPTRPTTTTTTPATTATTTTTTTSTTPTTTTTSTSSSSSTEPTEEALTESESPVMLETVAMTTAPASTATSTTQSTTTTTTKSTSTKAARPPPRAPIKPNRPRKPSKSSRPETHLVKPVRATPIPSTHPTSSAPATTTTTTTTTTASTTTTTVTPSTAPPPAAERTTAVVIELQSDPKHRDFNRPVLSLPGKPKVSRVMWKNSLVAIVVITLIFLALILSLVARKAMESFDRRHYTRLELNDLHYEV